VDDRVRLEVAVVLMVECMPEPRPEEGAGGEMAKRSGAPELPTMH
jgi:hypothetical protein